MSAKILVVEDEAVIAADIQASLEEHGYVVPATAATSDEALRAVARFHPDLILMDIRIRGDVDGIETAARIREKFGIPVIYLTSHADEGTLSRAKKTGAYGYLLKPFTDRDLKTAIEVALSKRELEAQLAERERWFATTLESIGDAVIATDAGERIRFMNPIAETVTGWTLAEAEGKPLAEVLRLVDETTGAPVESPLGRALRAGFAVELPRNTALELREGNRRSVDDSAAPIINEKGRVVGGVIVFRDVTERRELDRRLAQTERLAAIGTLSAGMAHEINNPLAYVLANVDYALETLPGLANDVRALDAAGGEAIAKRIAELVEALHEAKDGSHRVNRIVHDLKRFGRAEETDRVALELTDVLDNAIRMTDNLLRHHARVRRAYETTPFVYGNDGQLSQVFINLLVNAAQAFGDGSADSKEIVVATRTDDAGRAVAEVRDHGPGIPPELLGRIFDPFFTTKAVGEGSGIGLSICHSIVRAHGGEISVVSTPGKGTVFSVALPPAHPTSAVIEPSEVSQVVLKTRRARVLVIDDEPAIGRALARILQREHDVFVVTHAREAVVRMKAKERFDIIFCDLMMPDILGDELFATVAAIDPALARRIVFVTGGAFTPRTEDFLRTTANATMSKPVDPIALRRIVADYVTRDPDRSTR